MVLSTFSYPILRTDFFLEFDTFHANCPLKPFVGLS